MPHFYEHLGIVFEKHRHGTGPFHYASEIDGVVFEIYPLPKDRNKADDTLRLGFNVENLDGKTNKIEESGGKIVKAPEHTEWGYIAIIEDPDGRKIELKDAAK